MAATVTTYVYTGSGPTAADSTGRLRFKVADDNNLDNNNPIPIPASGTNYSYKKTVALYATVAPATSISNVKFYSDGGNGWTGIGMNAKAASSYTQATAATLNAGTADVFTYTSGSPLAITGSIGAATGKGTLQYVELQMSVTSGASPGDLNVLGLSETMTWQYDEA